MTSPLSRQRRYALAIFTSTVIALAAFAGLASNAGAATLPAPDILSGPADGATVNTDDVSFVFDYLQTIDNGELTGFVCTLDGSPIPCDGVATLVDLSEGVHVFDVGALLSQTGGTPICVLTICADPGTSILTDLVSRTFSVDLLGTDLTIPAIGGADGAPGANGANGTNATAASGAFALAWSKYKRQKALCKRQKNRIKKYKRAKTRKSARKRYSKCVRRQKKLRAAALAIPR